MKQPKRGLMAGAFDVIHPGYIATFKEIREMCDYLIVALHKDPSLERPLKMKPVLTTGEREDILLSLVYVDEVLVYETEEDLYNLLKNVDIDIRFLGDDYRNKSYTGDDLGIPVHFCSRSHGWSATRFKNLLKGIEK
jgi:glycerol-3-phosphate cytidylyltransferase